MRPAHRIITQRGLGPGDDELTDFDIVETDGVPSRTSVTMPAVRPSSRPSSGTTYSHVAPSRRQTPSMMRSVPFAAIECVTVTRRKTLSLEEGEALCVEPFEPSSA